MSKFSVVCITLHCVVQGHFHDYVSGQKGVSGWWTARMWTRVWGLRDGSMESLNYSCKNI